MYVTLNSLKERWNMKEISSNNQDQQMQDKKERKGAHIIILLHPSCLIGNFLIDEWELYQVWQESLCLWFSLKCICHAVQNWIASLGPNQRHGTDLRHSERNEWLMHFIDKIALPLSCVLFVCNLQWFNFKMHLMKKDWMFSTFPSEHAVQFIHWQNVLMKCHLGQLAKRLMGWKFCTLFNFCRKNE